MAENIEIGSKAQKQKLELFSLEQNRAYTKANAKIVKIGYSFFLTDTAGHLLIVRRK